MRLLTAEEIQQEYQQIENSLTTLIRDGEEVILLVGFDVARYVGESNIECKADFYGNVMYQIMGINVGGGLFTEFEQKTELYKGICKKYGYGSSVTSQGEYWKELLGGEKEFRVRILYAYLEWFLGKVEPFLKQRITEWGEREQGLEEEKQEQWIGHKWKKEKITMKRTKEILKVALDIWNLQNE